MSAQNTKLNLPLGKNTKKPKKKASSGFVKTRTAELVGQYAKLKSQKDKTELLIESVKEQIFDIMRRDREEVGGFLLLKGRRISFKIDVLTARKYGALKSVVDQSRSKELDAKGTEIPNRKVVEFLTVREKKNDDKS